MPNQITATGLETATQTELVTNFTTAMQTIYGSDVDLDSDTPDGEMMMIFIQAVLDLEDLLVEIYNMFDPDNAVGVILDQRVAINGIQRQAGTYTITPVTITVSQALNLYGLDQDEQPVYTVQDSAGNQYELQTTQNIAAPGTYSFTFQAASPGQVQTAINTITVPVTIVLGVTSINNPSAATTTGVNEETDAALKVRRQKSVALPSQGYLAGLYAALENVPGLSGVFIFENDSGSTDGNGVPGHSIWVIIDGAANDPLLAAWSATTTYSAGDAVESGGVIYYSIQDNNLNNALTSSAYWRESGSALLYPIAQAIYSKRNAGCGMKGSVSFVVTQVDGSPFAVFWDDVAPQNLFISFTATSINGVTPPQISTILAQLPEDFVPGVSAEVNINALATVVQQIDSNTLVTNAGFSNGKLQILDLSGVPASGTFELTYNGNSTGALAWNASTGTILAALAALPGLSAITVSGSLASEQLSFNLSACGAIASLITVSANSLETSGAAAIEFTEDASVYTPTLSPSAKNNQFVVTSANTNIVEG